MDPYKLFNKVNEMAGKLRGKSGDLENILNDLGGPLNACKCKDIAKALNSDCSIKPRVIKKLLEVCIQDPKDDLKQAEETLGLVSTLLAKIMAKEINCPPASLVPSVLKIIHMIKTEIYSGKSAEVKLVYFKTLLSFPNETFLKIEEVHFMEVFELLNLYLHQGMSVELRVQAIKLLHKYLKVLPSDKRLKFVQKGLDIWFLKLIPNVMILTGTPNIEIETAIEALEIVTDELKNVKYENDQNWQIVLQNLYTPQKYPAVMETLLRNGSPIWHRLWVIFIKLLKTQTTKVVGNFGSPINSMLPVAETAFKMDAQVRCQAFQCWDALIDNFAVETDEAYINKRIKLLVIPLRANNASAEIIVLAKFKTWWHLMWRFHDKVNRFSEVILLPFLHFCFGKPVLSSKPAVVPGLMSDKTKEFGMEAFVNILGHYNCGGCVTLPKIKDEVLTPRCLIDNWKDLIHCLGVALSVSFENPTKLRRLFRCAWMSFVKTISSLPENMENDKRDFFVALLALEPIQECTNHLNIEIVVSDLILPLFNNDEEIEKLLRPKDGDSSIVNKVLQILMNPSLEKIYKRYEMDALGRMLKPVTNFFVQKCLAIVIDIVVRESPAQYNSLVLWAGLSASVCEMKCSDEEVLCKMLLWPLKHLNTIANMQCLSSLWYNLFDLIHKTNDTTDINENILIALQKYENISLTHLTFLLKLSTMLLKQKFISEKDSECTKEINLVKHVISQSHSLNDRLPILKELMDVIQQIYKKLLGNNDLEMATEILLVIKYVLKLIAPEFKNNLNVDAELVFHVGAMLENIQNIIKQEPYSCLKQTVATDLDHCFTNFSQQESLKPVVLAIMRVLSNGMDESHSSFETNKVVQTLNLDKNGANSKDQGQFTTPSKVMPKQVKKKELSIVNTVVENGEEYVVVKSNWKFNPKKLTDKQKEKFQKHKDNIPALYQDLSQSQEEFRLSSWKTDSQDTTTTSSKSSELLNGETNPEISTILKNMPNTNVVPKILNNILTRNNDKDINYSESASKNIDKTQSPMVRETKTPKISLKDRVLNNRNFIEKSNVQKSDQVEKTTDDVLKTPTRISNQIPDTVINSAPSETRRHSRVIRKPKKFDDLIPIQKRRLSLGNSDNSCKDQELLSIPKNNNKILKSSLVKLQQEKTDDLKSLRLKKRRMSLGDTDDCSEDQELLSIPKNNNKMLKSSLVKLQQEKTDDLKSLRLNKRRMSLGNSADSISNNSKNINQVLNSSRNKNLESKNKNDKLMKDMENASNTETEKINVSEDENVNKSDRKNKNENNENKNKTANENITKIDNLISVVIQENESETSATQISADTDVKQGANEKNILDNDNNLATNYQKIEEIMNITQPAASASDIKISNGTEEQSTTVKNNSIQSSVKKVGKRKCQIEKVLAIEMVEGHPYLNTTSKERVTRSKSPCLLRRNKLPDNQNKLKKSQTNTHGVDKRKRKVKTSENRNVDVLSNSQDLSGSQDVIESSQDSTISVMSVLSTKNIKRIPVVKLHNIEHENATQIEQRLNVDKKIVDESVSNGEAKDDSEFLLNKTATICEQIDLTENMDTEPIGCISVDAVTIIDDEESPVVINTDDKIHEADTQDLTHISLQSTHIQAVRESELTINTSDEETQSFNPETLEKKAVKSRKNIDKLTVLTKNDSTKSLQESISEVVANESSATLTSKDEEQRKIDFLNNTLEISPIKTVSPVRDKKSPSPDSSSDYVVIKLTSPVHSNGQPYAVSGSPEVFTEEKVSPDKRDQSPPREETPVSNSSPKSLSLKKNKPQVRSGGRAAQMLVLCVPDSDRLQTNVKVNSDKTVEPEQQNKSNIISQTARRNLRMLYNSTTETNEKINENEEIENFLKLTREPPAADCSPSVPILKRKLVDIFDEATVSPASKRKRVSFHDPPVSTTVCVKKYIEPCGVRSPQNSVAKRQERQLRSQPCVNLKTQRRLDTSFKLEKALTKAVESFTGTPSPNEDTQISSLESTPFVEVVKNCELNDVDPICKGLVNCNDPIDKIAGGLSSPAMRQLLVREFDGKIETVGDLAKMTELEVNRLCIKAPKVNVAKKVLTKYLNKVTYTKNKLNDVNRSESDAEADLDKNKKADANEFCEIDSEGILNKEQTTCDIKEVINEVSIEFNKPSIASRDSELVPLGTTDEVNDNSEKSMDIQISLLEACEKENRISDDEQLDVPMDENAGKETPQANDDERVNAVPETVDMEMQTDLLSKESIEVQTEPPVTLLACTQTEKLATVSSIVQTDETGSKSTADIVTLLMNKPNFCEHLTGQLDDSSKQNMAESLPLNTLTDIIVKKCHSENIISQMVSLIDKLLDMHTSPIDGQSNQKRLLFLRDFVSERLNSKDLILFCSEVLKKTYDKA